MLSLFKREWGANKHSTKNGGWRRGWARCHIEANWTDNVCICSKDTYFIWCDVLSQVLLKPIAPQTQEEQLEYSLAAERRRVRMLHDDIIKDLLTHGCIQHGGYGEVCLMDLLYICCKDRLFQMESDIKSTSLTQPLCRKQNIFRVHILIVANK